MEFAAPLEIGQNETIICDAGTVLNYLNYNDASNEHKNKNFYFTDPDFIHKHRLGYTLLAIAEK